MGLLECACWRVERLRKLSGVISATIFGQSVHALVDEKLSDSAIASALSRENIPLSNIAPLAVSLEDVFVEMSYRKEAERRATEALAAGVRA